MPMTSMEISQLNGGYQSMAMNQMTHAGMIGQGRSPYGGGQTMGEAGVGQAANIGSAMMPLAMGGLAMAGLDPISMGVKTAIGVGAGKAGIGGALGGSMGMGMGAGLTAGLGVAGVGMLGLGAARYAGGQMMAGGQQQQQLGQMMRQNYGHMAGPYGGGMTGGDLGSMGQGMRQMTMQQGEMGQMVGFEELGRLASNMGRMGMTQGVRNAREFKEQFKKMITTLKGVAEELGTSLEEAQKMMVGMKGSGVFGAGRQAKFAGDIRSTAMAGGLGTSEVTGMASIGSQISRMVGGRGRAGAEAGRKAIGMIGTAGQLGVLSEEDIYDVTGQTGAEGRQAMATGMLQASAQFLKSGLGRRMVAAVAGKGGTINKSAMEEIMGGGVGTGRTMQLAGQNLAKIGRADFLRNEGRVRGEIMGEMGGLAPMHMFRGWLEQRGMGMGDDRTRLFMQRRLKMGRDQADQMMKLMERLPDIQREVERTGEEFELGKGERWRQQHTGVQGLRNKFQHAKSQVEGTLQQIGADFMTQGSEMLDRFVNKLTDTYTQRYSKDATALFRDALRGGATGDQVFKAYFGGGGGVAAFQTAGAQQMREQIFGGGQDFVKQFGRFDRGRMAKAGYSGLGGTQTDINRRLDEVKSIRNEIERGGRGFKMQDSYRAMGQQNKEAIRMAFATGQVQGTGEDRLRSFGSVLFDQAKKSGNKAEMDLATRYMNAGGREKAAMYANLTVGADVAAGESEMFALPKLRGAFGAGRATTAGERQEAIGRAFLEGGGGAAMIGEAEAKGEARQWGIGGAMALVAGPLGLAAAGVSGLVAGVSSDELVGVSAQRAQQMQQVGSFMESEEGRDLIMKGLAMGEEQGIRTREEIQGKLADLQRTTHKGEPMTYADKAKRESLEAILMAQDLQKMSAEGPITEAKKRELEKRYSREGRPLSFDQIEARAGTVGAVGREEQMHLLRQAAGQAGGAAREQIRTLQRGGILEEEGGALRLRGDILESLQGIGSVEEGGMSPAAQFATAVTESMASQRQMRGQMGTEHEDLAFMADARMAEQSVDAAMAGMSATQKREAIAAMEAQGMGAAYTGRMRQRLGIEERIARGIKKGGAVRVGIGPGGRTVTGVEGMKGIAGMLGVKVTGEDIKSAYTEAGKGRIKRWEQLQEAAGGAMSNIVMSRMGLEGASEGAKADLSEAFNLARQGKAEESAAAFQRFSESDEYRDLRKKALNKEDPQQAETRRGLTEIKTAVEASASKIVSAVYQSAGQDVPEAKKKGK